MIAEEQLALAFLEGHPSLAARALERLPVVVAAAVLEAVPARTAVTALRQMTRLHSAALLASMAPGNAAAILEAAPADEACAMVRVLEAERRAPVLTAMPASVSEALRRVLPFPDGTAGAEMDPSVFQVAEDVLVADARTRLRHAARDLLYYVYIVSRDGRLVGVLDIPELMLASARVPVSAAMHRDPQRLSAWMPVALVREHPGWHLFHAMPVVDEESRLLGAIRYQTLRRLEREAMRVDDDPAHLTARALGELFRVGTAGLIAGVAEAGRSAEEHHHG